MAYHYTIFGDQAAVILKRFADANGIVPDAGDEPFEFEWPIEHDADKLIEREDVWAAFVAAAEAVRRMCESA